MPRPYTAALAGVPRIRWPADGSLSLSLVSGPEWLLAILVAALAAYAVLVVLLLALGRRGQGRALVAFIPDCVVLFSRLARDPCLTWPRRALLAGLGLYLASPLDLIPDFVPVVGHLDDAIITAVVLRRLLRGCEHAIAAHWPGPAASLAVVLKLAGVRGKPADQRRANLQARRAAGRRSPPAVMSTRWARPRQASPATKVARYAPVSAPSTQERPPRHRAARRR